MTEVIPFKAAHVPLIKPDVSEAWMARAVKYERIAFARTVVNGHPIGCGGITALADGSAETWALFSPAIKDFPIAMFKACKLGINASIKTFNLNPNLIFACADPEDLMAHEFLERLGYRLDQWLFRYKGGG